MVEINFVANVETQANGSKVAHQSTARIEHAVDVAGAQTIDAAKERSQVGRSAVDAKIDEAAFQGNERLNSVVADVDSRTEFAVKDPQIRA
jgi:hypothetical protein